MHWLYTYWRSGLHRTCYRPRCGPGVEASSNMGSPQLQGSANTKTRSEVRGGGKKPYAQKGTGNARRGSQRTPLRPGGGVIFGPKPRDWNITMNKKERRLAMSTALQSAAPSNMVAVEDMSSWSEVKTAKLVSALRTVGADPMEENVLLITGKYNESVVKAGRNVVKLAMLTADSLNIYDVLRAKKVITQPNMDLLSRAAA